MKRIVVKSIAVFLLFVTILFSLLSCGWPDNSIPDSDNNGNNGEDIVKHSNHYLFPKGYTGGFDHEPGANIEYWWVETHEEVVQAIKSLSTHGTKFDRKTLLTYDNNEIDIKYCFVIPVSGKTEKIKWGDNPFERYAESVIIYAYAFLDDVTIDKINYSWVDLYNAYMILEDYRCEELYEDIPIDYLEISNWEISAGRYYKSVRYNEKTIIGVRSTFFQNSRDASIKDDQIKTIIDSKKIVELDGSYE